jgi:hypothetical protein
MDKRALVRRGVFPSDRVRQPTICFDAEYQKQMGELIDLMWHVCQEIKASQPPGAGSP